MVCGYHDGNRMPRARVDATERLWISAKDFGDALVSDKFRSVVPCLAKEAKLGEPLSW
jgi:hypothetical protein